jgi:hypothetical protein
MANAPVTIERQTNGQHNVVDATGAVLGKHNSVFSAARQLHDYYGQGGEPQVGPKEATPEPKAKKAHGVNKPVIPKPRIPKP